jgi:hypothetical protein
MAIGGHQWLVLVDKQEVVGVLRTDMSAPIALPHDPVKGFHVPPYPRWWQLREPRVLSKAMVVGAVEEVER